MFYMDETEDEQEGKDNNMDGNYNNDNDNNKDNSPAPKNNNILLIIKKQLNELLTNFIFIEIY